MYGITRATKIKIDLPYEIADATVQSWTDACNFISKISFENNCLSNFNKLHKLVYVQVKEFGLSAQVACSAIRHVASKYVTARTNRIKLKRSVYFKRPAVVLQGGIRGRDFRLNKDGLSIWTTSGRIKNVSFQGSPKLAEYLESWKLGDARLFIDKKKKVFIAVSFKTEVETVEKPNDAVIGIDRGINNIAVATDGKRASFYGGGHLKHVRWRYQQTRASLQSKKAKKNTRSIRRVLKRQSGKQAQFAKDINHQVSKGIIDFATQTGNPTIAIEALKGIREHRLRKKQRRELNQWPFYQLAEFIRYKAEAKGFEVIEIDPKYTSQGCSQCGHVSKNNRKRHVFLCKACNFSLQSDLNAARNIRMRGIASRQAFEGDALCQPALKHGDHLGPAGKLSALTDSR